jgi:uncharacterized protein (DUF952 family)
MLTYHQTPVECFDRHAPSYVPENYEAEGFIHTTSPLARIPEVATKHYRQDRRPYVLLTIDLDRIDVPWRYDAAGEDFPHIYGPLNREAVIGIRPMPRAADGPVLAVGDTEEPL